MGYGFFSETFYFVLKSKFSGLRSANWRHLTSTTSGNKLTVTIFCFRSPIPSQAIPSRTSHKTKWQRFVLCVMTKTLEKCFFILFSIYFSSLFICLFHVLSLSTSKALQPSLPVVFFLPVNNCFQSLFVTVEGIIL